MTNKILRSIFLAAIITFIASLLLIMWVLNKYYGELQEERLASELSIAAVGIEQGGEGFLKKLPGNEDRFTWIAPGGKVLFDSQNDASSMENHSDRKEVKDALKDGEGRSRRFSSTHTEETVYRTKRLPDGTVLRNSASRRTMLALAFSMFQPFAIIIAVAFIISFLLAENLAKKIVKPLESIDLDEPLKNNTYDELAPMLKRLAVQHSQIRNQKEELKIREREFAAVTDNMNEGLVLLNDKGTILAINPAARAFFETGEDPVGKDFLSFERNYEISRMIDDAKKSGNGEVNVSRNGREYRIGASAVESEGAGAGVVILIFDVTEKVFAERNRREFTANVSHEIKTPLQSIMGSAELIENGLVKSEDLPRFVGRIRSETARLVTLVNDAIRLSKLDENAALQFEDVDLYALAAEEIKMMRRTADDKGISLNLEGESA
ncbi:MAG: two-component sensor histidine kinase, partial [Synergistes sp.]|nr:two-component sensor histidine kinase [Synergistes sp.]